MARVLKGLRSRIGCISLYEHHGAWWIYHRHGGKPVRRMIGESAALAECEACLLNAKFVADGAGITLASIPAVRQLGLQPRAESTSHSGSLHPATSIPKLREAFLSHHENVLRSTLATVSRYRTATLYLQTFGQRVKALGAMQISAPLFMEHLRTVEISPNGHPKSAKRRLRDKGVRYVLECCRSMYHFGQRHGLLPKSVPNPFTEMRIGSLRIRDAKPIFVFNPEQEIAFFKAAGWWDFTIHFACAKTGVRPGELSHALIEDVDLNRGWLHIRNKPELGWTTKTSRERRVPLVLELVEVLRHVIGKRTAGPLFLREKFDAGKRSALQASHAQLAVIAQQRIDTARKEKQRALFRTEEATILERLWHEAGAVPVDRIRTSFILLAKAAGLPATCPKCWRHTFATLLQEANVDLLVRQETMGHKPASSESSALGMTGVYTHTTPEFQRREIDRALRLRPTSLSLAQSLLHQEQNHGR